jgi:hypothetical protein
LKTRLLLSFLLMTSCLTLPLMAEELPSEQTTLAMQQPAMQQAIEEIFGVREPGNYRTRQGGPLTGTDGTRGFYLIMAEPEAKVLALVADVRTAGNGEGKILKEDNLEAVTAHLFKNYIGVGQAFNVDVRDHEKMRLAKGKHGVARMAVTFADGYVEPDMILRLEYPNNRTVVLLLGMPEAGGPRSRSNFSEAYQKMEGEARAIISQTTLSQKLLPTERYILWRLREIFWP